MQNKIFSQLEQKKRLLKDRASNLEILKFVLNKYKETNEDFYWDYAKWLGGVTARQKKDLETNNFVVYVDDGYDKFQKLNFNKKRVDEGCTFLGFNEVEKAEIQFVQWEYNLGRIEYQKHLDRLQQWYRNIKYGVPKIKTQEVPKENIDKLARSKLYPMDSLLSFTNAGFTCCPFHNEKSPSMKWYRDKNTVHCFGCGKNADVVDVYMQLNNVSFLDAVDKLQ